MNKYVKSNCLTPDGAVKGFEYEVGGINVKTLDGGLSK